MDKKMFWVGHTHDGITIFERCYNTLEEAQQDIFFQKGTHIYSVYSRGAVIVETDNPHQWERENNRDGISFR